MHVSVQEAPFDPSEIAARLGTGGGSVGAQASFTGLVRGDDGLTVLEVEHYPGMTETVIREMAQTAMARFGLIDLAIVHRYGRMAPGEPIVTVAAAAAHRAEAFAAAEFLMDWLKGRAPFWKKEHRAGGADWVAQKAQDEAALERWS